MNLTLPKQVAPWPRFPSGEPFLIASTPGDWQSFASDFQLTFEEHFDDLDAYMLAAIEDEHVGQIWLWSYKRGPAPTTMYYIDSSFSRQDGLSAIHRTLGEVDLDWVTPVERKPGSD